MRSPTRALASMLLLAACLLPAFIRAERRSTGADTIGWVPRSILERAVPIRSGVGRVHEPVTTSSADAQAFYDQGLAYLHSYVWIEAARSFNQALRADPGLAMAYLGLSYAYSGLEDDGAAAVVLERAEAHAARASDRERQRIEIRRRQLRAMAEPDDPSRLDEYRQTIDAALAVWPDDAELWLRRGNAAEPSPWGRGQRGTAATIAFYEAALARTPDHLAAHHYLTHTYETIGLADRALKHGEAHARLAPAIPHAQHMFGHDLRRTGQIESAVAHFEHTRTLEEEYYRAEQIPAEYDWHHAHNLSLLATAHQHQGRMRAAEELLHQVFVMPKYMEMYHLARREWVEFLLGRGRTADALTAARDMQHAPTAGVRAVGHALGGQALAAEGKLADAEAELGTARQELAHTVPRGPLPAPPAMIAQHVDALQAELLLRTNRRNDARPIFESVITRMRATPGPDVWIGALFRIEAVARLAREVGDWSLAEHAARQMLEHDPAYAGGHYALALVAAENQDAAAARREFAEAVALWKRADGDLPELADARRRLAELEH